MNKEKTSLKSAQKPERLLCLELESAKQEIFRAISVSASEHNIPNFLLEGILLEALSQVREGKRTEIETAEKIYQRQLDEYNRDTGEPVAVEPDRQER